MAPSEMLLQTLLRTRSAVTFFQKKERSFGGGALAAVPDGAEGAPEGPEAVAVDGATRLLFFIDNVAPGK